MKNHMCIGNKLAIRSFVAVHIQLYAEKHYNEVSSEERRYDFPLYRLRNLFG